MREMAAAKWVLAAYFVLGDILAEVWIFREEVLKSTRSARRWGCPGSAAFKPSLSKTNGLRANPADLGGRAPGGHRVLGNSDQTSPAWMCAARGAWNDRGLHMKKMLFAAAAAVAV